MGTITRQSSFTFDDFCVLVKDGQKGDLIDGVIYMASPENLDGNDLFGWLFSVLKVFVQRRKLGKVFGTRVAYRLDDKNSPEPDIGFVVKERLDQSEYGYFRGPPDLAIEIVSRDSVERDYIKKRRQYEKAGVREYWIIDPELQKVTWLRRDSKGKFREIRAKKGVFQSQVISGLWVRPEWFWQDPLPDLFDLLTEMLSEK